MSPFLKVPSGQLSTQEAPQAYFEFEQDKQELELSHGEQKPSKVYPKCGKLKNQ